MTINFSGKSWAHKTIPQFTDAELLDAMEVYERAGLDGYALTPSEIKAEHGRR